MQPAPPKLDYSRPGVINALRTGDYVKATIRAVLVFINAFLAVLVFFGMVIASFVTSAGSGAMEILTLVATVLASAAAYSSYSAALKRARERRVQFLNAMWSE